MRGHLRQRKRGTWELVADVGRDPLTGKHRQRSRTFHGTKRDAERELRALLDDIEGGRLTGRETSVDDLLHGWLQRAADQLSATTMREYRRQRRTTGHHRSV